MTGKTTGWGRAEELVFGERREIDRVTRFDADAVSLNTARILVDEGYAPANCRQNCGPRMADLVETAAIMADSWGVEATFGGYVVPASRPDARVTFDTVRLAAPGEGPCDEYGDLPPAAVRDFRHTFGTQAEADSVEADAIAGEITAWWD